MKILLTVIAVGVTAIASVLVWALLVSPALNAEPEERKAAREDTKTEAEYYCSYSVNSLDDPRFATCVARETESRMEQWDRENPEHAWDGDE